MQISVFLASICYISRATSLPHPRLSVSILNQLHPSCLSLPPQAAQLPNYPATLSLNTPTRNNTSISTLQQPKPPPTSLPPYPSRYLTRSTHETLNDQLPHLRRQILQVLPLVLSPAFQRCRPGTHRDRLQPTLHDKHPAAAELGRAAHNGNRARAGRGAADSEPERAGGVAPEGFAG
jgi:hypothetical protein